MDKAKAAVSEFLHKSNHHDTTVEERVAPAVKREIIKPHVHEEIVTAVDKEVHEDHYHRTIQPILDREVLPEKHTAKIGEVQHRQVDHRSAEEIRAWEAEQAALRNTTVMDETTHTQTAAPALGGKHVHHHIHEVIQPVIHKETIQPTVVHTTVPIHEVHYNKSKLHETSQLPAMTMSEFKKQGGVLEGREERYDSFEGEPKHIGGTLKKMMDPTHHSDHGLAHEGLKHGHTHEGVKHGL